MPQPTTRSNKAMASLHKYAGKTDLRRIRSADLECACISLIADTLHYATDRKLDTNAIIRVAKMRLKESRK